MDKNYLRLPDYLKRPIASLDNKENKSVRNILSKYNLNTVCDNARCPNKTACYGCLTATFLIMGKICTRNCRFCNINGGVPEPLDINEQDIENLNEYKIYNLPVSFLAKSWCDNQIDGFIKIITKDDLIKGAHIVSNEASSLISQIQIMMITNYKVSNIKDIVFAHPTYSEGIMEAILNG